MPGWRKIYRNVSLDDTYISEKRAGGQKCLSQDTSCSNDFAFPPYPLEQIGSPFSLRLVHQTPRSPLLFHGLFLRLFLDLRIQFSVDASRGVWHRSLRPPPRYFSETACKKKKKKRWANEHGEKRRCFFGATVRSAGYFLSCGKRRMWRTRTKYRIVLWPSADLSCIPLPLLSLFRSASTSLSSTCSLARSSVFLCKGSFFNSKCVLWPIREPGPAHGWFMQL